MDTTAVAQSASSFGELAGYALMILATFIGFSLLFNGWPDWKRRK